MPLLPSVSNCGAGCHWLGTSLTTKAQTNRLKLDRVQNKATWVILLHLPPMQTRQKGELQCHWKSPQPTPWSCERHKGMQTGSVLDGSSRGLNTTSKPADRAQANQGVGKVPKTILASLWESPARKLGKALLAMASRQNRIRDQAFIQ